MIKEGKFVTYKGNDYKFKSADSDENIILISSRQDQDFIPSPRNNGMFLKEIPKSEVEKAFYIIPRAYYNGVEFALSDGKNGKALLDTGDAQVARKFNFERTDKYMYSKYVNWDEISIIEKVKPLSI